jgi:predicted transglutaminase-like cysteine proteinase
MRNLFTGFIEFVVVGDALLRKWRGTRDHLDVNLENIALSLADIATFNADINKMIRYAVEPAGYDEWQIPAVTMAMHYGDCEDIAILKYATLLKSGVSEDDMRISLGRIKSQGVDHAWLALWLDGGWHVLDSKFDQMITPDYYVMHGNWLPVAAVWGDQCVRFGKQIVIAEHQAQPS